MQASRKACYIETTRSEKLEERLQDQSLSHPSAKMHASTGWLSKELRSCCCTGPRIGRPRCTARWPLLWIDAHPIATTLSSL
ncbi:hypothetical protein IG631_08080 [Alternaria alternata]|nr:hypothetical protein IG631_08080 [Alternaria alternata]